MKKDFMKKIFFLLISIGFGSFCFGKGNEITNIPEEVVRPSILRLSENGYRWVWNYNKRSKVTLGKVNGKSKNRLHSPIYWFWSLGVFIISIYLLVFINMSLSL